MDWLDVWYYLQGNVRFYLFYNMPKFMRRHIKDQIDFRLKTMNQECYSRGSCIECGCQVPHLQMADKTCDGNCYPKMMSINEWMEFNFDE